jgi:hypothetical protein
MDSNDQVPAKQQTTATTHQSYLLALVTGLIVLIKGLRGRPEN